MNIKQALIRMSKKIYTITFNEEWRLYIYDEELNNIYDKSDKSLTKLLSDYLNEDVEPLKNENLNHYPIIDTYYDRDLKTHNEMTFNNLTEESNYSQKIMKGHKGALFIKTYETEDCPILFDTISDFIRLIEDIEYIIENSSMSLLDSRELENHPNKYFGLI